MGEDEWLEEWVWVCCMESRSLCVCAAHAEECATPKAVEKQKGAAHLALLYAEPFELHWMVAFDNKQARAYLQASSVGGFKACIHVATSRWHVADMYLKCRETQLGLNHCIASRQRPSTMLSTENGRPAPAAFVRTITRFRTLQNTMFHEFAKLVSFPRGLVIV